MKLYDIDALERDEDLMVRMLGLIERVCQPYHRPEVSGVERIPEGPALYTASCRRRSRG